jgi:dihydrodipicolinate synthase/N-acetylneuraminate lyase
MLVRSTATCACLQGNVHREQSDPIKAAMAMAGMIEEVYRLPMTPLTEAEPSQARDCSREAGILPETAVRAA